MMRFNIMTLFAQQVSSFMQTSVIGRACSAGYIDIKCYDIRDYTQDKHKRVDDTPYGGGYGMVMQADPIYRCFNHIKSECPNTHVIYMSPKGKRLTQTRAKKLLTYPSVTILCGHYEGVDQRVIDLMNCEEISIGDYVLTGGELPAMVLIDAAARMVDGVLASHECYEDESIYSGLLEYPQYTRPADFMSLKVPEILQNGDHAKIKQWRLEQSLSITKQRRKDLYTMYMKKNKEYKNDK